MHGIFTIKTIASLTLLTGLTGSAVAQTPAEILARKPVQTGVNVTTPTAGELTRCVAEPVKWPSNGAATTPTGIMVKDARGQLVRQFIDTTGRNKTNIWSYYLDGVEAYREVDGNGNGTPDQFRWLASNGGKWGFDANEDGTIDSWRTISPEELSQELFLAMQANDSKRMQAILPTEEELKSLGMPAADTAKMLESSKTAAAAMTKVATEMKLTDSARWVHLETALPNVTPADSFGGRADLVKKSGTVLVDMGETMTEGESKAVVFQTGTMIEIGKVWKLIDGPSTGGSAVASNAMGENPEGTLIVPKEVQPLIAELDKLTPPTNPEDMADYQLKRAEILERVVGQLQGDQQISWLRQVIDAYAAAAEAAPNNPAPMKRLDQWNEQIGKLAPGSDLAAYSSFRVLTAEYATRVSSAKPEEMVKVQAWWREQLEAYIKAYPKAEQSPEAMIRLAVAYEFAGPDGEAKAKEWYNALATNFPQHPAAAKAAGAVKRLSLEGKPFELTGQTLDGKAFSMDQVAGKTVIVYYWASWARNMVAEMKQLTELVKANSDKGVTVVTISLDEDANTAIQTINAAELPGSHIYAPGGLDRSPHAVAYGIQMVPHIMIVGKDGKVVERNAQGGLLLRDTIEKMLK